MRILPGSHIPIMAHWDKVLAPERRHLLPRVHGLTPKPNTSASAYPEYIPEPDGWSFTESEPHPVAVKRGTAQIFTQSMLHAGECNDTVSCLPPSRSASNTALLSTGWHNSTDIGRKGFIIGWAAAEVPVGFVKGRRDGLFELFPPLRKNIAAFRPGREHIVPDRDEHIHFVTEYDPSWPETWIDGQTRDDYTGRAKM